MTLAHVTRAGTEKQIEWIGGGVQRIALDANATGGRLAVIRQTMRGAAASPVHVHANEDETILLLSGSGTFWAGDQRWDLKSGDTAFLPRGLPHAYVLTSDEAELLTICNPAGFEEFIRAAGWDLADPKPEGWAVDMSRLAEAAAATGQTLLGPPLALGDDMPAQYLGS
ncbi:cupin domain-containing protein [Pseudonocardia zijingensis]|jgi:quercetin dioxygenase-like cupin family protein|uniref:Cupin domain-containing protein n=1 Tax=Pseudonocardia zijingensis TaxID=153376 RepID=A0ABN1PEC8_9PSEU